MYNNNQDNLLDLNQLNYSIMKVLYTWLILLIPFLSFSQYTYIPDDNFEQALIDLGYDDVLDNSVLTTNINNQFILNIEDQGISDLTGIEGFTALQVLNCSNNDLSSADFSNNPILSSLDISSNTNLEEIELSNNYFLTTFIGYGLNNLEQIDLTNNDSLVNFMISDSEVVQIDLSNKPNLYEVNISYNYNLTTLDLSNCTNLYILNCYSNNLTTLDLSSCTNLNFFNCYNNNLTALDLSSCTNLNYFYCSDNNLTTLDLSNCTNLYYLYCYDNNLTTLDLSSCTNLYDLYCYDNQLNNLYLGSNISGGALETYNNPYLNCINVNDLNYYSNNTYSSIDPWQYFSDDCNYINGCTDINADNYNPEANTNDGSCNPYVLGCEGPNCIFQKTYVPDDNFEQVLIDLGYDDVLDDSVLTVNINIILILNIEDQGISDLTGIEGFTALQVLNCSNNDLSSADFSNNPILSSLDISSNTNLEEIELSNNYFLTTFIGYGLNNLEQIDLTNNDSLVNFMISDSEVVQIDLSNKPNLYEVNISYNYNLTTLDLSNCTNLYILNCYSNNLTTLDLSSCTNLNFFNCYNNNLTALDLSSCTNLNYFYCSDNNLTTLDLSNCTNLYYLYCYDNNLTTLDLSSCTNLYDLYCYDNQLNNLYLGSNISGGALETYNNPYLNCINVNDLNYYSNNTYSSIDPWQYFSDDCFGSSWDCVEGACVEQIGAIGTYQSIQECDEACNLFSFCSDFSNIEEIGYQFYPDTIENINSANVNEYYEQNIQFLTPEIIGDVFGDPYYLNSIMINIAPLPIDSIEFVEILGLPDSFDFEFSNEDGIYDPNTLGCLKIFGTANNSDIGDHDLTILLNGWLNANLIGTINFYETLGEYEEVNGYVLTVNSFESWTCSANGCYDPIDGSGEYQSLEECQAQCFAFGCTDDNACNFDPEATINDFSCEYPIELYDCNGNCLNDINQNGICDELDISGCNDDNACNYNPNATILDSCIYPEPGYDCNGEYQCEEDIVVIFETQDPSCQEANDGWLYIVDISGPDGIETLNDIAVYNSDNEYVSNYNNLSSGNYYFTVTSQIHQCSETFQFGLQINEVYCEIIGESTVQNGQIQEYFYYQNYNNSNISTNLIVQGGEIISSQGSYFEILWDIPEGENGLITVETYNQYSEGNFCENECTFIVSLPAISYNCNANGCYNPQDGSGEYESLEECEANCNLELTYIPDDNFEQKLINLGYDNVMDDYVITNNINTLTYLNVGDSEISDLTGIEDFTQLTYLHCSNNELTELNLSQNQQLVDLYCNGNQLTELNLSQNSSIVNLYCSNNELINLDVSQNTMLVNLYCSNNELISLDVSQNAELTNLNCGTNLITSLDLSQNTLLTNLYCSNNQISILNINLNTQLTKLYCGSNNLIDLDISQNTLLNSFICLNNSSLYCIKVWDVGFANNSFTYIDSQHYFSIDCFENWSCIDESCIDPMDGTGIYQSLVECEANCNITIPDSWNCIDDACIDPMDGTGIYQSFDVCESECGNISSVNENIIEVNIFPNPSSNIFNLEFNSDSETEILVTNILGEKIYFESTQSSREFKTQIDLSNYSKGIYNLTIKTSDGLSNHKLILQ